MKTGKWFDDRFIEDAKKVVSVCAVCTRAMWFPPSKAGKYVTCGPICAEARAASLKLERRRCCLTCTKEFFPRGQQIKTGGGKYCCRKCAEPVLESGRTPQSRATAAEARTASMAEGVWTPKRGDAHPQWKGGRAAYLARAKASGARREWTRKYRRANPDKVREFTQRRRTAMTGSLPRGTVQRIGALQRWKCAICRVNVRRRYHLDHVTPLARGGEHVPQNLQLLCPPCNVRKSAKDPIAYMQERGFLL